MIIDSQINRVSQSKVNRAEKVTWIIVLLFLDSFDDSYIIFQRLYLSLNFRNMVIINSIIYCVKLDSLYYPFPRYLSIP